MESLSSVILSHMIFQEKKKKQNKIENSSLMKKFFRDKLLISLLPLEFERNVASYHLCLHFLFVIPPLPVSHSSWNKSYSLQVTEDLIYLISSSQPRLTQLRTDL